MIKVTHRDLLQDVYRHFIFNCGPVVKNLPANAGDMGSVPAPWKKSVIPERMQIYMQIFSAKWSPPAGAEDSHPLFFHLENQADSRDKEQL